MFVLNRVKTRLTVTLYCDQAEEGKVDPMTSTITLDYVSYLACFK